MKRKVSWGRHIDARLYGRVTDAHRYRGERREILAYCARILRKTKDELETIVGDLRRIDLVFLTGRQANAVVVRHEDRFAIGICVGLPLALKRYVDKSLAQPQVLAEYLKPDQRPQRAWRYLGMMIQHVYLHEAAHALRAHFLYSEPIEKERRFAFDELSACGSAYLELDADLHALDMWVEMEEPSFPDDPDLRHELYFLKVFTLQLLYQVLDSENLPIGAYNRSHPPPVHRCMLLSEALLTTFATRHGFDAAEVENAHHQAIWESSVVAKAATLVKNRWWGTNGRRQGIAKYKEVLRHYLETFEPELDAFGASLSRDPV